ncbi:MAG: glycoside hydrolase family 78 protein [Tannerellaceae bacterium]|nr:glycoside hydrolase family 78 protein [Tannerellaceae bacterium]
MGVHILSASSILLKDLRCENLKNPIGIDNTAPHFSWKVLCDVPMRQQFYEIQAATDSIQLYQGKADLWDSGKTNSNASVMIPYQGKELNSRMLCYWRVRVGNERGDISEWSPIQRFAVGVLENDALRGKFISLAGGNVSSPLLRKSFTIEKVGTTFLHVNSLGYHEVYVNGKKADDSILNPAVSQLNKRSLIVTYDITPFLKKGDNELLLWLGKGWYKKTTFKAEHDGPVVRVEMDVLKNDNWEPLLVTDATWQGRESGYSDTGSWNALRFGGERIDARMLPSGLTVEELDKLQWTATAAVTVNDRKASPQMCESNKIQEIVTPKTITLLDNNTWLIDMGKVLTGWFELQIPQMSEGHAITASYSDFMKTDGSIDEQGESDKYIASGKVGDVFRNKFHYHAFRYVKISNLPDRPQMAQIKAYLVHGDYHSASTFVCSDTDLNAIHDMVNYTLKCLVLSGYMVDCPHLERAGYGGDGNSSTQIFQTMYDAAPTFVNWLQAWKDVMQKDGGLPHVAPAGGGGGGPYWCGFIVLAPWRAYVNYGDSRLLERCYGSMKKWFGYVDKYTVNGLLKRWPDTPYRDWYLGDWLAPAGVDSGNQASIDLVNNCFISDCLDAICKIATVLGYENEAKSFAVRKEKLNTLIHQTFYNNEENIYATGSQLDMAYPMLVGAVPDRLYASVREQLKKRTEEQYKGHIGVGLVGVPILTDWAIRNKEADFMYHLLKQPDYPGYLHMLNNGATTTWEYWNGERSRVHNCYNGVGNWFYQAVGGILPDEDNPGYRHFFIDPQVPERVTWAHTSKETPYGAVVVNWRQKEELRSLHIVLPVGVKASVVVPENAVDCCLNGKKMELPDDCLLLETGTSEVKFLLK